jgi:hypothetical protein
MKPMRAPTIPGYFSEAEQAARAGVTVETLRRWRGKGIGPKHVHIGRHVAYPVGNDEKWIEQQAEAERKSRVRRLPGRRAG